MVQGRPFIVLSVDLTVIIYFQPFIGEFLVNSIFHEKIERLALVLSNILTFDLELLKVADFFRGHLRGHLSCVRRVMES